VSSGFSDPIIGGGGALIYPAIKSPNFSIPSQTGWAILKNGSAYFFNVTASGIITATEFAGTDFVIDSAGEFFYSGTPALGNLIAAIAPNAGGTDAYGNVYPQGTNFGKWNAGGVLEQHFGIDDNGNIYLASSSGVTVVEGQTVDGAMLFYGSAGQGAGNLNVSVAPAAGSDAAGNNYVGGVEVQNGGQIITQGTAASIREYISAGGNPEKLWLSGYANEDVSAGIFTNLFNIGDPDEYITWWLFGPSVTGQKDAAFIQLNSSQNNAADNAFGSLGYDDTSGNHVTGMLNWGPGGINGMGTLTAVEPGTGTVSVDAVAETWHNITLSATWTAATPTPQYRLNADGLVELKGAIIFTSTGAGLSGNNAFTAAGAIPSAYQPAGTQYFPAVLIGGSGAPTITANRTPVIELSAGGQLTLLNVSSTGAAGDTVTFSFPGVVAYQQAS
jgi:hypothetical protein